MESITIKVDAALAKAIDKAMRPLYSTKTEFIREAIRDKIEQKRKEESLRLLKKYFGAAKKKVSDADLRRAREQVGKEYMRKYGL